MCYTDLVTVAPAVLLLVVIKGEEVSPAGVVLLAGVIQLVGVAGDVVLKPGEAHLDSLVTTTEVAASCGDHDPGIDQ